MYATPLVIARAHHSFCSVPRRRSTHHAWPSPPLREQMPEFRVKATPERRRRGPGGERKRAFRGSKGVKMAQSIEDWYKEMPIVTRTYLTLAFLTTVLCSLEIISPFTVYFNLKLITQKLQLWRLLSNFFFFGNLGLDFLFHMFFLSRYCRLLEEGSFRNRTADFVYMLLFGGVLLLICASFAQIQFLGQSLTFMMVYVWARRNQHVNMSFLGLFNFTAPYLPWVLAIFSVVLGSSPVVDVIGMIAGHLYYFLEDIYPAMRGRRLLKTPGILKVIFDTHAHIE